MGSHGHCPPHGPRPGHLETRCRARHFLGRVAGVPRDVLHRVERAVSGGVFAQLSHARAGLRALVVPRHRARPRGSRASRRRRRGRLSPPANRRLETAADDPRGGARRVAWAHGRRGGATAAPPRGATWIFRGRGADEESRRRAAAAPAGKGRRLGSRRGRRTRGGGRRIASDRRRPTSTSSRDGF